MRTSHQLAIRSAGSHQAASQAFAPSTIIDFEGKVGCINVQCEMVDTLGDIRIGGVHGALQLAQHPGEP